MNNYKQWYYCKKCGKEKDDYIYYNPVSSDITILLCTKCDKKEIEKDKWTLNTKV